MTRSAELLDFKQRPLHAIDKGPFIKYVHSKGGGKKKPGQFCGQTVLIPENVSDMLNGCDNQTMTIQILYEPPYFNSTLIGHF